MHILEQIHSCGHLYVEDGHSGRGLDVSQFHCRPENEVEVIDLPGFVEADRQFPVTYESHHFWVYLLGKRTRRNVLIVVNHGGGWEVWQGDYMLADALERYGDDKQGLFKLCWYPIDTSRESALRGMEEASKGLKRAFVEGRLKKRKMPRSDRYKVWVEPPLETTI